MDAVEVCELIGQPYKRHGGYCITNCYNTASHSQGDRHPSLTVYDDSRGYYCYSCGESGSHSWLFKQFGIEVKGVTDQYKKGSYTPPAENVREEKPKKYKQYDLPDIYKTLGDIPNRYAQKLKDKGWGLGDFQNLAGWRNHTNEIKGWGYGVFIPYFDMDGKMVTARLRLFKDHGPRFMGLPDGESYPYMMHNLKKERVFVCEGETDTLTLMFLGIPAVGIPGSTNAEAIKKLMKEASKQNTQLIAVPDSDEAGSKFLDRLRVAAFEHFVRIETLTLPVPYKDVNDFYVGSIKEKFEEYFLKAITGDDPQPPVPPLKQGELL